MSHPAWHRIWIALLLSGSAGIGVGQAEERVALQLDPNRHVSQYIHRVWQTDDGLPQNSVYATAQTPDGFLWIATQEGLARFDGVTFTLFSSGNVGALQNDEIRALLVDNDGALWIGTGGGGVTRYADRRFETFTTEDGLGSGFVRSLLQSQDGTLWVGTVEGGLSRFDGERFTTFTTDDGLTGNVILDLEEDANGMLWIGTEGGLTTYSDGQFEPVLGDAFETLVWAIESTEAGVWVGTNNGLVYRAGEETTVWSTSEGVCGDVVSALYEDAAATLWIGTLDGGVCRLANDRFDTFGVEEGLTNSRVRSLLEDAEGNLWIGTDGGGLNQLRMGKFIPYAKQEGLSSNATFAVLEDQDGVLWVGTEGGGLNRAAAGSTKIFEAYDPLPSSDVYALYEDEDGALWVGTYGSGVCRLDASAQRCWGADEGLVSPNVYAITSDETGGIWLGTDGGLQQVVDERVQPLAPDDVLADALITALHRDAQGQLWVGTYGSGLYRKEGTFIASVAESTALASGTVMTIHEDEAGLWVGMLGDGLCRVVSDTVACLTEQQGLPSNKVLQILEDDQERLWMATMRGLFHIEKEKAIAALEAGQAKLAINVFGRADGLRTQEANGGTQPAAWKARNGDLWFTTMEGLVRIDPSRYPTNTVAPPVHVLQLIADSTRYAPEAVDIIPPGRHTIELAYTGISLAAPEAVTFEYRLLGYDEAWMAVGTRRTAYYTNLNPGVYTFEVRAQNLDGVWSTDAASLTFEVLPLFYQTTWFYLLAVTGLVMIGFVLQQVRVRQLRLREAELSQRVDEQTRALKQSKEETERALVETERARQEAEESRKVVAAQADQLREMDRVKTRFFNNISHEFRTPLTLIIGPLENVLSGASGPLSDKLREQVEIMLRNARRLLRLINQLLDLAKAEAGHLRLQAQEANIVSFLEGIVFSFSAFATERNIDVSFDADQEVVPVVFDREKMEKVFFNLLSNALKFTPQGGAVRIQVALYPETDQVCIEVHDSGPGIPAEQQAAIFDRYQQVDGSVSQVQEGTGIGLALTKELVILHRGTINVTSVVGEGTAFTVHLPLSHPDVVQALVLGEADQEQQWLSEVVVADPSEVEDTYAPVSVGPDDGGDTPLKRQRVLVVDDNPDIRDYIRSILEPLYIVDEARDGVEALEEVERLEPDLVLSDVMMPRLDGYALCSTLKENAATRHLPVILLTAKASIDQKVEGLERGADDYVSKPFNARELLARIRNMLTIREQAARLKVLNENLEEQVSKQLDLILAERLRYENELINAKEKAEEAAQFKSTILDNMSHEMRTPIAGILGFADILREEIEGEKTEFVDLIHQSGERLLRTINSILDLSKLESGGVHLEPTIQQVVRLTETTLAAMQPLAKQRGLALRLRPPKQHEFTACWDQAAYERILTNLVSNAIKFTESGEVIVGVECLMEEVYVTVQDTGVGISPQFLPDLFEAFRQESQGLTRNFDGAGIGLSITKRLVDAMHGTIQVQSKKGIGTTFTVILPRGLAKAKGTSPDTWPPQPSRGRQASAKI